MSYDIGDSAHFHTEFRDPHTGSLVDPDTVQFKYMTPSGVEHSLTYGSNTELTRASTGRYVAVIDLEESGTWTLRWQTTGNYQGADEFTRLVAGSAFS